MTRRNACVLLCVALKAALMKLKLSVLIVVVCAISCSLEEPIFNEPKPSSGKGDIKGDITEPEIVEAQCPISLVEQVKTCAQGLFVDPEQSPGTIVDSVELCGDAEPLAKGYDALCFSATPPDFCGFPYELFYEQVAPHCKVTAYKHFLDESCVFGARFHDILDGNARGVSVISSRTLNVSTTLSALKQKQIVLALHASAHTDVTTVEEAFDRVDEHVINTFELWDATHRRAFTAYEYGAGDNSYGRIFAKGKTKSVAEIHDGDMTACTIQYGPELRDCLLDDASCAPGLTCMNVIPQINRGVCVEMITSSTKPSVCTPTITEQCKPL